MVELLVAMAIIGLLIAVAIWGIGLAQQSARNTQRREAGSQIVAAVSEFYSRYNVQPVKVIYDATLGKLCLTSDPAKTVCTQVGSLYAIGFQGIVVPSGTTLGSINAVSLGLGTSNTGDSTHTYYKLGTNYTSGGVTGTQVCVELEGGGYANLSDPSAITCP